MNLKQSDTEFVDIMKNFIDEVDNRANLLSDKQKELIKMVLTETVSTISSLS